MAPAGAATLQIDKSKCWSCRYWDWAVGFSPANPGKEEFLQECHNPAEYMAGDDVALCPGWDRIRDGL